jgi:hypothetical protein
MVQSEKIRAWFLLVSCVAYSSILKMESVDAFETLVDYLTARRYITEYNIINHTNRYLKDSLCGLLVRVPGYRSRGPGSVSGATRFSEK